MANIVPVANYDDIVQIDTFTRVLGGPGGPANFQAQNIANRFAYLESSAGAGKIGHDGENVSVILNTNKKLAGYSALRAYTGTATRITLTTKTVYGDFLLDTLDTTSLDNGISVIVDGSGRRWKRQAQFYTASMAEAVADWNGTTGTNNTSALLNLFTVAANDNKQAVLDGSGDYLCGVLQLPANVEIVFSKKARVVFTGTRCWSLNDNLRLIYPTFKGPLTVNTFALINDNKHSNIRIYQPKAYDCQLINTNPNLTYAAADWSGKTNIASDIEIYSPEGIASGPVASGANPFIFAAYVDGFKVFGGRSDGYAYGFTYWGGDSNPAADGAVGNARKCDNIQLFGHTANGYGAGAWGSMGGHNILFDGVICERQTVGGDVGIDHEGTLGAKNIGCHVKGYANGNYAAFAYGGTIEHIGCTSEQFGGYAHFRNYNTTQDATKANNVKFIGGAFSRVAGSSGLCTFDDANGCFKSFKMQGSELTDTVIKFDANNCGSVEIECTQKFNDASVSVDLVSINTNASSPRVYDVSTKVLAESGGGFGAVNAVKIETSSFNYLQNVRVHDCYCPSLNINFKESGGNAGISGIVHVYSNVAASLSKTNSGARNLVIARSDNNFSLGGGALSI